MHYRPEIDGLRAVAVLPVILFHAGLGPLTGGFLGVDVFFVISGYLITSIIARELADGRFSLPRFYERRARRILPAFFLVMITCFVFAWLWLVPDEFEAFSKSFIQASLSISNFYFLDNSGYFAPAAAETPLLHTWSLAVEEQFYLLFPLLVLLLWKTGRKTLVWVVVAIALSSLLLAESGSRFFPAATFYLLPARAWELLAGALVSLLAVDGDEKAGPTRIDQCLAVLGLGLIVFAFCSYDETMRLPSLYTLVPVCGTMLVLHFAVRGTVTAALLSTRLLVGIGLISYSAYLWHQPLFVFARLKTLLPPSPMVMLLLCGACLMLSFVTWRYVEQPFRRRQMPFLGRPRHVAAWTTVIIALFIGLGTYGVETEGAPKRLPEPITRFLEQTDWSRTCLLDSDAALTTLPNDDCLFNGQYPTRYAVWGDSIASSLAPALIDRLAGQQIGVTQLTQGNCVPIRGIRKAVPGGRNCEQFNDEAYRYLLNNRIDTVVMAGLWNELFTEGVIDRDGVVTQAQQMDVARLSGKLAETLIGLQKAGIRVLLVYPHPTLEASAKQQVAKSMIKGEQWPQVELSDAAFRIQSAMPTALLDAQTDSRLLRARPADLFCNSFVRGQCVMVDRGALFLTDKTHFSETGARMLAGQIVQVLGLPNAR